MFCVVHQLVVDLAHHQLILNHCSKFSLQSIISWLFPVSNDLFICFCFFLIWVFYHKYSRFIGQQGKGEDISLTPLCHFHSVHRHLDISRMITAKSSPLLGQFPEGQFPEWTISQTDISQRGQYYKKAISTISRMFWRTIGNTKYPNILGRFITRTLWTRSIKSYSMTIISKLSFDCVSCYFDWTRQRIFNCEVIIWINWQII